MKKKINLPDSHSNEYDERIAGIDWERHNILKKWNPKEIKKRNKESDCSICYIKGYNDAIDKYEAALEKVLKEL